MDTNFNKCCLPTPICREVKKAFETEMDNINVDWNDDNVVRVYTDSLATTERILDKLSNIEYIEVVDNSNLGTIDIRYDYIGQSVIKSDAESEQKLKEDLIRQGYTEAEAEQIVMQRKPEMVESGALGTLAKGIGKAAKKAIEAPEKARHAISKAKDYFSKDTSHCRTPEDAKKIAMRLAEANEVPEVYAYMNKDGIFKFVKEGESIPDWAKETYFYQTETGKWVKFNLKQVKKDMKKAQDFEDMASQQILENIQLDVANLVLED